MEAGESIFSWTTFFRIWKLGDVVFWCICVVVCLDAFRSTNGGDLPCRSKIAHMFSAYLAIKGVCYAFELCLVSCSQFFRHPKQFETRYIMSFLPFLSWLFAIVIRHASVFVALVEVAATESDCWKEIRDTEGGLAVFFWWAMVYECVSLSLFMIAWVSLPFLTLYLLSVAIRPRTDTGLGTSENEPLTEFCKEQFHKHIRSGDAFYDFFLNLTGLSYIVKKNDLARMLVTSNQEQELSKKDVMLWSTTDVFNWLKSIGMGKYGKKFVDDRISGNLLLTHVDPDLLRKGFGCKAEDAEFIWNKLNELRKPTTVGSWSVNEVCDWLCRIGMAQYMEDFRQRKIDGSMLLSAEEPLRDVMTTIPEYHRIRLLNEMQVLRNEGAPMTVGTMYGQHPLNSFGRPMALKQSADDPNDLSNLRDVDEAPQVDPSEAQNTV